MKPSVVLRSMFVVVALPVLGVPDQRADWTPTTRRIEVDAGDLVSLWVAVPAVASGDLGARLFETAVTEFLVGSLSGDVLSEVTISEHGTFCGFTGEAAVIRDVNARLELWATDPGVEFQGDAAVLLRDKTLLRADDETSVLPGDRLRFRLGGRAPLTRDALRSFADLDPEDVLDELRAALDRVGVQRVGLGNPGALPFTSTDGPAFPLREVEGASSSEEGRESFPRLDAHYRQIGLDWSVSDPAERAVAELAESALRFGAAVAFGPRGGETAAAFRLVERPFLTGRLLLGRRGVDGAPIGDLVDEMDRFRREFATSAGLEQAFEFAVGAVTPRLAPTERSLRTRVWLHQRARLLVESALLGAAVPPDEAVANADLEAVREFLRDRLDRPLRVHALIPQPR